jgi:L-asparaginase/Glu-tRNA(Gln) amidotransferase subunit D
MSGSLTAVAAVLTSAVVVSTANVAAVQVARPRPLPVVWILATVLNDEISGARDVTKTNTFRVETFRAPELGFLGYVDADQVTFNRTSTRRHTDKSEFDVSGLKELPKVDILYSYIQPSTQTAAARLPSIDVASLPKGISA